MNSTCPQCGLGKSHFYYVPRPRDGRPPFYYCNNCRYRESSNPAIAAKGAPRKLTPAQIDQAHQAYTVAASWAAMQLWQPAGAQALANLRGRGLTDATILALKLGYHPAVPRNRSQGLGDTLFHLNRDIYDGAIAGGILGKQGRPLSMMHEAITIPYEHAGTCTTLRTRKLDPNATTKYWSPAGCELYAGGTPTLFLHHVLANPNVTSVILTEGEFKAALAWQAWQAKQLSMPAVATPGIGYLPDALLDALAGRTVYLVYDVEQRKDPFSFSPGEQFTIRNGEKLTGRGLERRRAQLQIQLERAQRPKRGKTVDQNRIDQLTTEIATREAELDTALRRAITVKVVRLPRPADVDKVDLDSFILEHGPAALVALLDKAPPFADWYDVHGPSGYDYERGGTYNGHPLANYQVRFIEDVEEDDGIERTAKHRAVIRTPSGQLRTVDIFNDIWRDDHKLIQTLRGATHESTAWDKGHEALQAFKDLSRRGDDPAKRLTYICPGWKEVDGCWHYLMPDGAITASGPVVHLASELQSHALGNHYELAAVKGDAAAGARAFKRLLFGDVGAQALALLLAGHAALAPLHRFMSDGGRPLVYAFGESGALKSAFVRVFLSLYGPRFTAERGDGAPLAKWESTYNALELNAFTYCDVLFCIDDYKQATAGRDVLARFLHSYSESSSRGRMTRDLKQQRDFPARCIAIITGEDRPTADSGQLGRVLLCPVSKGDIVPDVLQEIQRAGAEGHLAAFWREFVQAIAQQLDQLGEDKLREKIDAQLRSDDAALPGHQRTAGALRQNRAAWLALRRWMEHCGYLAAGEAAQLDVAHLEARHYIAEEQAQTQHDERPATIWLNVVRELLATGRAVLEEDSGMSSAGTAPFTLDPGSPVAPERVIGFWYNGLIALQPTITHEMVQKALGRRPLAYSKAAIFQQLASDGVLAGSDRGKTSKTVRHKGSTPRVLLLRPAALIAGDVDDGQDAVAHVAPEDQQGATDPTVDLGASQSQTQKAVAHVAHVAPVKGDIYESTAVPPADDSLQKTFSLPPERCNSATGEDSGHKEGTNGVAPVIRERCNTSANSKEASITQHEATIEHSEVTP